MRVLTVLMFGLPAASAFGHGGTWRGPGDSLTPDTGGGGNPSITSGLSGREATTDRWEIWWGHNREPYLTRHTFRDQQKAVSPVMGFRTGRGHAARGDAISLAEAQIRHQVLPVLVAALKDRSSEVADSACIAIGRAVPARESGPFVDPLVKVLAHEQLSPREAAVLGLGILGNPEAAPLLRAILQERPEGKRARGRDGPIPSKLRALAALSLGLLGDPDSVPVLLSMVRSPATHREVATACVLSLGLHSSAVGHATLGLLDLLRERKLDREIAAQIPISLQRLPRYASRVALEPLTRLLRDNQTPHQVRRSCAIALGSIAGPEDEESVRALLRSLSDSDVMVRNYACISLGRIGEYARPDPESGRSDSELEALRKIHRELLTRLRRPGSQSLKPFAALALGLFARGVPEAEMRALTTTKLSETFADESSPTLQGAFAIGLGLSGAEESVEALRRRLASTRHPALQGHLATALGLLGDAEAVEPLRTLLEKKGLTAALRLDLARSLALLGDRSLQGDLIELLREAGDQNQASATAKALGLVGDREAVAPLLEIVSAPGAKELERAFGVVALGLLAEKGRIPWNAVYAIDSNYTLGQPALREVLSIL